MTRLHNALFALLAAATPSLIKAQASVVTVSGTFTVSFSGTAPTNTLQCSLSPGCQGMNGAESWNGAQASCSLSVQNSGVTLNASATNGLHAPPYFDRRASASADVVVRFSAPVPTAGTLDVIGQSPIVDIGNDGTWDLYLPVFSQATSPVSMVIDQAGIEVRIQCNANAVGLAATSSSNSTSVTFTPLPARLTSSAAPCGPSLQAVWRDLATTLSLDVNSGSGIAVGAFVLGFATSTTPVPPTQCALLIDVAAAVTATVDAAGLASYRLDAPPAFPTIQLYGQFVGIAVGPLGEPLFRSSNRIGALLP